MTMKPIPNTVALSDADIATLMQLADAAYRAGDMATGHAACDAAFAGECSKVLYGMLMWKAAQV